MSTSSEPGVAPGPDFIPLCVPEVRGNEWQYVKQCLDANWVSSVGEYVDRFEAKLAARIGVRQAIAVASGTAALHLALRVAGVQPDDEVLVSALSFIAPANAVRYLGAWPRFIDAEANYWQFDPERLTNFLERECDWQGGVLRARQSGRRIGAVVPVDILGHPVDMEAIAAAAGKYRLPVIEDACESLGASYRGASVGSRADISCFSFNGNKIITTGGGGMLATDNEEWANRAKYLSTQAKDDPVEYVHREVGYNYRLTNVQAAMGVAQMEVLDEYVATKRRLAAAYADGLADVPGVGLMPEAPWAASSRWLYTVLIDEAAYGMTSRDLLRRLEAAQIQARPLWQPLSASPAHAASAAPCPTAEALCRQALSLPSSVGLAAADQQRVIGAIADAATGRAAPLNRR